MAVVLLDFVRKALRVAKQALGNRAEKPESGGLPRETHIVAHCLRKEEATYLVLPSTDGGFSRSLGDIPSH